MENKISTRFVLLIMILFMASSIIRLFCRHVLINNLRVSNKFTEIIFSDIQDLRVPSSTFFGWEEMYPFEKKSENESIGNSRFEVLFAGVSRLKQGINQYAGGYLFYKTLFEWIGAAYDICIGWNLNEAADLGNLNLWTRMAREDYTLPVSELRRFKAFLDGNGIDLLAAPLPPKICRNDTVKPGADYTHENFDSFLNELTSSKIPFLDLRDEIHADNLDHHSLFYNLGPHWKPKTAKWMAEKTARYLNNNNNYDADLSLFESKNYYDLDPYLALHDDWGIPSKGFPKYTKYQDGNNPIIAPLFDTDFSLDIPGKAINKRGSFDIFYKLKKTDPPAAYLFGINALVDIHNYKNKSGKKTLIISDCQGVEFTPFFALAGEYTTLIDLRSELDGFTGSVESYIKIHKPDTVILLYGLFSVSAFGVTLDFR